MRTWMWIAVLALCGCPKKESGPPAGKPLVVRVPANDPIPETMLVLEVAPALQPAEVDRMLTPLSDAVYAAVKQCPEAHPKKGEVAEFGVRFSVQNGKIGAPSGDAAKAKAQPCVASAVQGKAVPELPIAYAVKAHVMLDAKGVLPK